MSLINDVKANLVELDLSKKSLRKFGITIAFALSVIGIFIFWKGSVKATAFWLWGVAALFLLSGLIIPNILTWFYQFWMGLAFTLGWFMTRLLLGIMYYLIFTPVGLSIRLFGGDLLKKKMNKSSTSYWIKRKQTPFDSEKYEHLF